MLKEADMKLPSSRFGKDPVFPGVTRVQSLVLAKWLVAQFFETFAEVLCDLVEVHLQKQEVIPDRYPDSGPLCGLNYQ